MVIYPFFCPWKTRRALVRGALLGAAILGALFGLERGVDPEVWPAWLGQGDWARCAAAGLLAFPVALLDYGRTQREGRAPLHWVLLVLLVSLLGLLLISVAPAVGSLAETLRTSTPKATLDELLALLWPLGACTVPTALVFTAAVRERWRGSTLGFQLKVTGVVGLIGSVGGALTISLGGVSVIAPFVALVAAPVLLALLLPLVGAGIDWADARLFPLHDPTAEDEPAERVARSPRKAARSAGAAVVGDEIVSDESSGERVFTWDEGEEEPEEDADILGPDDDSSGLDGIADRIFDTF